MPAPIVEGLEFSGKVLRVQLFKAHAMRPSPVHPVIAMVELDPNIADQPATRHVLTGMTPITGFPKVTSHIQRELLDDRPAANQVRSHGPWTQGVITHALVYFVPDSPALALAAVANQLLRPLRITGLFHERPCPVKYSNHNPNPF